MTRNTGTLDRVLRVILGVALLASYFLMPDSVYRWFTLIGIIPLLTGLVGTCPIYSMFGLSTRPTNDR